MVRVGAAAVRGREADFVLDTYEKLL
jgi:hypothetical protein